MTSRTLPVVASLMSCAVALMVMGTSGASAEPSLGVPVQDLDRRIADSLESIEAKAAQKSQKQAELKGLSGRRAAAHKSLKARATALYRMSRAGLLPLAGGFGELLSHVGRLARAKRMVRADLQALARMRSRSEALRAAMLRLSDELQAEQSKLTTLQQQRAVASLDPGPVAASQPSSFYGLRVVDPSPVLPFSDRRGQLALPITGSVDLREAQRDEGEGVEFLASAGTPVQAVAAAQVAFAGRRDDYGRMVILDHGEGYFTVYGGLTGVAVGVGDQVGTGARLGVISGSNGQGLVFEIRKGSRPLAARPWLGL